MPYSTVRQISSDTTGRFILGENTTFYVDTAGNDANDGLTPGTAKETIQAMLVDLRDNYNGNGFNVTIQLADGTYDNASGDTVDSVRLSSIPNLIIQGNTGDNTLVKITNTSATNFHRPVELEGTGAFFSYNFTTTWEFKSITFENLNKTAGEIFFVYQALAIVRDCRIDIQTGTDPAIRCNAGKIQIAGSFDIDNAGSYGSAIFAAENQGYLAVLFSTINVNAACSATQFVQGVNAAFVLGFATYNNPGNFTGLKALADYNSVISGGTGMPGAGTSALNGGQIS